MHALAGERVEVTPERRDQGLALTGLHLGDLALVQHHRAEDLNIVGAHAKGRNRFGVQAADRGINSGGQIEIPHRRGRLALVVFGGQAFADRLHRGALLGVPGALVEAFTRVGNGIPHAQTAVRSLAAQREGLSHDLL